MSDENRPPDALYVPTRLVAGPDPYTRGNNLRTLARKHLATGEDSFPVCSAMELHGGEMCHFVRKSLDDTILFPTSHPRAGEVRHDWRDGPDGIKYGYSKGD